jgi:hypothetical protein
MKLRERVLICGASGTGKTNCLIEYIDETCKPAKGSYKHIYLCRTVEEPLYTNLMNKLKKKYKITIYNSVLEWPNCQEFPDNTDDNYLFIFDDCVNDRDSAPQKKIKDYFIFGRKKGLMLMFLTQSYFQTNKTVRDQMNHIILLSIKSSQDLNRIIKEYETPKITNEQVNNMMDFCIKTPLNFMKINTNHVPIEKKISLNFTDGFLDPKEFLYSKTELPIILDNDETDNDQDDDDELPQDVINLFL